MLIALVLLLPVAVVAWIYLAPALDRVFGTIWAEDAARLGMVQARLIELRRKGVGEQAALAIVAREAHVTERQVMQALDLLSPADVSVMAEGRRTLFQHIIRLLDGRRRG